MEGIVKVMQSFAMVKSANRTYDVKGEMIGEVEGLGVRLMENEKMSASAYLKQVEVARARLYRLTYCNCLVIRPGSAGQRSENRFLIAASLVRLAMRN